MEINLRQFKKEIIKNFLSEKTLTTYSLAAVAVNVDSLNVWSFEILL